MNKYGLIIGCDYSGSWKVYQSCNDAKTFYDLLVNTYNIPKNNILTLYNSECTRNNIINCMNTFVKQLKDKTVGIIYFAGHGTQTRDTNGDELDGMDENYQTYDRKIISDDEITSIVEKSHIGSYINIISDHCHSGTMLDINESHKNRNWISIGSAQDNQSALQSGDGSICSYELFKIIRNEPNITIKDLKERLTYNMKNSFIGDMQLSNISISNNKLYDCSIFGTL